MTFNASRAVLRPIRDFSDKDLGEVSQCQFLEVVFAMWVQSTIRGSNVSSVNAVETDHEFTFVQIQLVQIYLLHGIVHAIIQ